VLQRVEPLLPAGQRRIGGPAADVEDLAGEFSGGGPLAELLDRFAAQGEVGDPRRHRPYVLGLHEDRDWISVAVLRPGEATAAPDEVFRTGCRFGGWRGAGRRGRGFMSGCICDAGAPPSSPTDCR
jgi:hypothetical protein